LYLQKKLFATMGKDLKLLTSFDTFKGKSVLITGHTGFKGSWLTAWLSNLGANITGISLDSPTKPSHFEDAMLSNLITDLRIDIRDQSAIEKAVVTAQPDFIFHLAAQSLVRKSYDEPIQTWQTNVMGTLNVLEALRKMDKMCTAVVITSDKCYENVEWIWGYRETDALGGADPYSASKGAAEFAIYSHINSYFPKESSKIRIASARAGNVIGGGDWASDRIIPDCVRSWSQNDFVNLRNPHATRPWQHVLEPLSGYLTLALSLAINPDLHGESFNFGPRAQQDKSVLDLVSEMSIYWDQVRWKENVGPVGGPYEAGLLKLNCDKALHFLNWHASMDFKETVRITAEWYKLYYQNPKEILSKTNEQIKTYIETAKVQDLKWAR